MGEVRLALDARIGREVAMKIVRPGQGSRSDLRSRFLREARVQGQLEHPAVVPVYDLGARPDGAAFFTMKRVRGKTLEEVLDALRARDAAAEAEFSRRKLLTAFASVCLAIEFAHARSVVHRDLKPGNVMLGGFGEVYVLDWGLAKVKNAPDVDAPLDPAAPGSGSPALSPIAIDGKTEAGAVMGTPGYMAPEQLHSANVDARADVYALGAILFELCTLRPLHNKPTLNQVLDSTLRGPETRASVVAPEIEIPPELEAIWTKATALKRDDRYASARELVADLEGFLDGDRDLEQRRKMADMHAERGEEAAARARTIADPQPRKDAMQELGRALALDPSNARALRAMGELLAAPPQVLPPEAEEELVLSDEKSMKVAGRAAAIAYASWFLFLPFTMLGAFHDQLLNVLMAAAMAGAGISAFTLSRQKRPDGRLRYVSMTLSMIGIAVSSRMFGPFVMVPALALSNSVGFAVSRSRLERRIVTALGIGTFAVPLILEYLGILAPTFVYHDGRLEIVSHMLDLSHPYFVMSLLAFTHVAIFIAAIGYIGAVHDHLKRYERDALLHTWHFRQLAPDQARTTTPIEVAPTSDTCGMSDVLGTKKNS
ncbi:MAG TPA: protein kinase, partial [Polyangiaceae bacterium]